MTSLRDAPQDLARRWRSEFPFVLPRFEKIRGVADDRRIVDSVDEQIRRELAHRSLSVAEVQVDRDAVARIALRGGRSTFAGSYRRLRKGDGTVREAVTATLTFDEPVQGPIAIGRYAHFGLGQFVPIDDGA